jgi:hypothetical protein
MVEPSQDRLPELPEAEAEGATARIYDGLKTLGGVPMVALIYRHLATIPGALEWTWATLYPALAAGALQERAWRLASQLELRSLPTIPRPALRVLGVSAADETAINTILDAYNRSNPVNILVVACLKRRLRYGSGGASERGASRSWSPPPAPGPLPPMIDPDRMAPELVKLVAFLRNHGSIAERRIVPSLYRHLAHWPGFLALAATVLSPRFGDIARDASRLRAVGEEAAAALALEFSRPSGGVAPPDGPYRQALEATLDSFTGGIPKTVVIGTLLRRAMPPNGIGGGGE